LIIKDTAPLVLDTLKTVHPCAINEELEA